MTLIEDTILGAIASWAISKLLDWVYGKIEAQIKHKRKSLDEKMQGKHK